MRNHIESRRRAGQWLVAAMFAFGLFGCTRGADLSAVEAERGKPVHRYDVVQALVGNGAVVVAGLQSGGVLVSGDGGRTWARRELGGASVLGLASCADGSLVGIDFKHKVWSADAQGANWKSVALDKPRTPLAVTCDARGQWWVAGSGAKLAVSADRGASWRVSDLAEDAQLTTLQFVDEGFAVATGEFGLVAVSHDGGASWKKGARLPGEFYPYATLFVSRQEGYTSGIAGQILRTRDGGASWTKLENATGAPLYRLFLHEGRPYGVGAGGVVARLEGEAFVRVPYPDAAPVFLGAGASLPGALVLGGPGGLVRVIGTPAVN